MKFPLLAKAASIGAIVFLLTLVLVRIDWLVSERKFHQAQAAQSVAASLAGEQTLLGPLLQRNCTESWTLVSYVGKKRAEVHDKREFTLHAVAHKLAISSDAKSETRYRGLFKVQGFAGPTTLDAQWSDLNALKPAAERKDSKITCQPMIVQVVLSDVRGLRKGSVLMDGAALTVNPGTRHERFAKGFHAELPARADELAAVKLVIQLDIVGTGRLAVVPAAQETTWQLRSDWPHPSFAGRFLPQRREVSASGFSAEWAVSALSTNAPQDVLGAGTSCERVQPQHRRYDDSDGDGDGDGVGAAPPAKDERGKPCLDTFDVSFFDPVNPYSLTDRATKYALLFIVLTFAAVALTEVLGERRVHPIQYTLVGLALALFYLLLLSLSEHITFASAYAVASAACVLLLAYYGAHMLGRARSGVFFGAGMAGLYGLLWVLLQAEQTALAIGSVLLFAVLAAVMVATRKLDWYRVFASKAGADPAASIKV
jgi:inner membrane protein